MAKILNYIVCVFLLCNCNNSGVPETGVSGAVVVDSGAVAEHTNDIPVMVDTVSVPVYEPEPVPLNDVVNVPVVSLVDIYTSYIGVREATGKNDGVEVERFLKSVGLGKGYPWCAAFVKTCLLEAGILDANRINGMALSCENKNQMIYKGKQMTGEPQPGDVFTLYYASLKRIGHTGFHHRRINSSVYESVEGNTNAAGSREGDGVYKKKRSYNATHSISRWHD